MSLQEFLAWHIHTIEINYIVYIADGTELSYIVHDELTRLLIEAFAYVPHRCYIRPMVLEYDYSRFRYIILLSGWSDMTECQQPYVKEDAWPAWRPTYDALNEVDPRQHLARAGLLSNSPALSARVADEEAIQMLRRRGVRVCQYAPIASDVFTVAVESGQHLEQALLQTIKDYDGGSTGWLTGEEKLLRGNMLFRVRLPLHGFPEAKIWFEDMERRIWRVPNERIFTDRPSARRSGRKRRRSGSRRR